MKKTTILFLTLFIFTCTHAQHTDEQQIATVLNNQKDEWNKGNIEKFMIGYWENDSLVFMSKNGPIYGYKSALNNYKKNYSDTLAMGKLHFEIISIKKLSNNYAFVIGKYFLTRSIGNANGAFTLLFRKINGKWEIIVDHTS
ncbi:MAG: nuclear transport factor 2 family protein [Bacteroidetes bacterium]|nr:nuclear transport factor 2 family protein [Bacteroidota bacterium]MBS1648986.1 nuclear transport factor 2 family protein [Bacteroidota bacterium]